MKKILLLFALSLIVFAPFGNIVLAQAAPTADMPLEVKYPTVPETQTPTTVKTPLPNYVQYIFNFFMWTSGLIALVVLVIGGSRYVISAGNVERMRDAKNQIYSAILGLLLLLSTWIILYAINPDLTKLSVKKLPIVPTSLLPGVYLCTARIDNDFNQVLNIMKQINSLPADSSQRSTLAQQLKDNTWLKTIDEKCWRASNSVGELDKKVNDLAVAAYTVSADTDVIYGAVIYDESKYQGRAQVVYKTTTDLGYWVISDKIKPSSVRTFTLKQPRSGSYVQLYELIDFNKAASSTAASSTHTATGLSNGYYYMDDLNPKLETVGSVKIEGQLIVIFFKDRIEKNEDWIPDVILDVVIATDANLYDNVMGRWCERPFQGEWTVLGWSGYYPCPKTAVVLSGGVY